MEEQVYSNADALKMMIDGELLRPTSHNNTYFKWTGSRFCRYYIRSNKLFTNSTAYVGYAKWVKHTPKPEFKVGDRVKCSDFGRGRVLEVSPSYIRVKFETQPIVFKYSHDTVNLEKGVMLTSDESFLGTTVDGVDIYEDYKGALYHVHKMDWSICTTKQIDSDYNFEEDVCNTGFFSTRKAAEDWIKANKPKVIVGTTLDGVEIEEGVRYILWAVNKRGHLYNCSTDWEESDFSGVEHFNFASGYQRFSTKEAAQKWKEEHLVGITAEGWHVWKGDDTGLYYINYDEEEIKYTGLGTWEGWETLGFEASPCSSLYFKSKEKAEQHLEEYLASKVIYPKDSCVVVTGIMGDYSMPMDHIYKLSKDCTKDTFTFYTDVDGHKNNGYRYKNCTFEKRLRAATEDETKAYALAGKPIHIDEVEAILKPKVRFEEGDTVVHPAYGEGVISRTDNSILPIFCEFTNGFAGWFTINGKLNVGDVAQTLFFKPETKLFEVGHKVRCLMFGEGEVVGNDYGGSFPVKVKFIDGDKECYRATGQWREDMNPTLFHIVE